LETEKPQENKRLHPNTKSLFGIVLGNRAFIVKKKTFEKKTSFSSVSQKGVSTSFIATK